MDDSLKQKLHLLFTWELGGRDNDWYVPALIPMVHEELKKLAGPEATLNLKLKDLGSVTSRADPETTPLHHASGYTVSRLMWLDCNMQDQPGSIPVARALLTAGADLNAQDSKGSTPLMLACASGSYDLVDFYIARGAKLDMQDDNGNTALSGYSGAFLMQEKLIKAGASAEIPNKTGRIVLEHMLPRQQELYLKRQGISIPHADTPGAEGEIVATYLSQKFPSRPKNPDAPSLT